MRILLPIIICFLSAFSLKSQSLYFPPIVGDNWDTLSPASLGWCTDKVDDLLQYLDDNHTKGFILLKDGKIVIEKYFGTFARDSFWYWASAGKSLTSFMVGLAQQENYLSISDTTSKYLGQAWTNCSPGQEDKITIRHQLTMTTGLDDGVPDNSCILDTCLVCLTDAGTRWAYHNAPYTLLTDVLEHATGQGINNYFISKLQNTTGITGAFFRFDYDVIFVSRARSMARYGLLILNQGNWNGNQLMTDTTYFHQMVNTSQSLNLSYGYLWWLNGKASFRLPRLQFVFPGSLMPSAPDDMVSALGKNGQIINVVPSQNLVLVRIGDVPGSGEVSITFNDTVWQKLNAVICNVSAVTDGGASTPLNIYPNPAKRYFSISLDKEHFDFAITGLDGKIIISQKNNFEKADIDCNDYPPGMYIINVFTGKNSFIKKIIIQ